MIWYKNPLLKTSLQMILKKSNQRMIQIAAQYGSGSFTFKQFSSMLEKGPLQDYVKQREHVTQRGVDLGTIKVLDIRKLFKAVETGKIDRTQLNEIVTKFSGIRIDRTGNIEEAKTSIGIPTIKQIRRNTQRILEQQGVDWRELSNWELDERTEFYYDFNTNFQTSYDEAVKAVGKKIIHDNKVTGKLWDSGKKGYDQLIEIKKWLDTYKRDGEKIVNKIERGTT